MWAAGAGGRLPCPRDAALRRAAFAGNLAALPAHLVPSGRSVRVFISANPEGNPAARLGTARLGPAAAPPAARRPLGPRVPAPGGFLNVPSPKEPGGPAGVVVVLVVVLVLVVLVLLVVVVVLLVVVLGRLFWPEQF